MQQLGTHLCFLLLYGPPLLVLLHYVAPMVFVTAASDPILLFRQGTPWSSSNLICLQTAKPEL